MVGDEEATSLDSTQACEEPPTRTDTDQSEGDDTDEEGMAENTDDGTNGVLDKPSIEPFPLARGAEGILHLEDSQEESSETDEDLVSVVSAASATSSYLHGEQAEGEVRRLVSRSLHKKQKEQARRTRPKKETKRVAAGGQRRDKRAHKMKIQESLKDGFF